LEEIKEIGRRKGNAIYHSLYYLDFHQKLNLNDVQRQKITDGQIADELSKKTYQQIVLAFRKGNLVMITAI